MSVENAKTKEEYEVALEYEQDLKDLERIYQLSHHPSAAAQETAKMMAYHKYGVGECECSNCIYG